MVKISILMKFELYWIIFYGDRLILFYGEFFAGVLFSDLRYRSVCILIPPSSPLYTLFGEFQQKKNRHSTSICKINSSRLQTPFFNLHLHHHPSRPSLWVHTYLQLPRPWLIKYFPSSCVHAACFILKISAQPSNPIVSQFYLI